jgi:hypothetical protein
VHTRAGLVRLHEANTGEEAPDEPFPDWLHYMNLAEVDCLAANAYTEFALTTDERRTWQHYTGVAEGMTQGGEEAKPATRLTSV